jgi:hypothetical protein
MHFSAAVAALLRVALPLSLAVLPLTAATAGKPRSATVDPMDASVWEIGPILSGHNFSLNMPASPSPHPDGWSFDFPQPSKEAGHVHYVTFPHGSLKGKSGIVLRYRIEAEPGVQILPQEYPTTPSTLTLYFQRRGDNWSGKGAFEHYRWWATFRVHMPLTPGEHQLTVRLDENWTSVMGSSAADNPRAFRAAISDAERVGFTFGGGGAAGHGVYATGPARFVLTGFEILSDKTDFGIRSAPGS